MLNLETGKVFEIIYQDDRIQILDVEMDIKTLIEKSINYIGETGICSLGDRVVVNTIGNRLGLGTGGFNLLYLNLSNKLELAETVNRNEGHIIKMKYTPGQIRVKTAEEFDEYRCIFNEEAGVLNKPVIYAIIHSMIAPLVTSIKYIRPDTVITCVYTYGGAMNANNSFILRKLRKSGLIDNIITTGECYGGDYETINMLSGILFGFKQLKSDIIIVCCGPGVAGSSTYYGFSTFDFAGSIYLSKQLGLLPVIIPRISMVDKRERHMGISMQSIAILQILDFPVMVPLYKDNDDIQGFDYISSQLRKHGIFSKHNVMLIDDPVIKKAASCLDSQITVMGRSYKEDPWFFNICSCTGIYCAGILNK